MDFERLVSPLTLYLEFLVDFWTGGTEKIIDVAGDQGISERALLLSLIGVGIFIVSRYGKLHILPEDPDPLSGKGPSPDTNSLIFIFFTSLTTPLLFEVSSFLLGANRGEISTSAVRSINAGFLSVAALYPLNALHLRLNAFSVLFSRIGSRPATLARIIYLLFAVPFFVAIVYCFRPFWILHPYTSEMMMKIFGVSFLIFLAPLLASAYFIFHWNLYVIKKKDEIEVQRR